MSLNCSAIGATGALSLVGEDRGDGVGVWDTGTDSDPFGTPTEFETCPGRGGGDVEGVRDRRSSTVVKRG